MGATAKTPLGAIGQGLVAGAIGTAIFTGYQALKSRLESGGGSPDSNGDSPPATWSEAPTPAQVGHRFLSGVFRRPVPPEQAPLLTNVMHWLYGTGWGALYGVVQESLRPGPIPHGLALGGEVIAADYTLLPAMRLYKPPWRYPAKVLATDLANHAVYGLAVAGAYSALDRLRG